MPAAAGVEESAARVEALRGLTFLRPVEVVEVPRTDLRKVLLEQIERESTLPPAEAMRVLEALLLIPDASGALDDLMEVYEAQVLAFYDPTSRKYYTFDSAPDGSQLPEVLASGVAIHELTHALQDQRFDAGRRLRQLEKEWDRQMAYHAVLEGEATLVMLAAMLEPLGTTIDDLAGSEELVANLAAAAALNPGIPADADPYFVESMKFPYIRGLGLVLEAYRRGGWKGVDALHESPPTSTEEVLRPALYFDRRETSNPPACADPKAVVSTALGRFHWAFLLGEPAADGLVNDCVRVSRKGDELRVEGRATWSSQSEAAEFATALERELESRNQKGSVERNGAAVEFSWGVGQRAGASGSKGGGASSPSTSARASSHASNVS